MVPREIGIPESALCGTLTFRDQRPPLFLTDLERRLWGVRHRGHLHFLALLVSAIAGGWAIASCSSLSPTGAVPGRNDLSTTTLQTVTTIGGSTTTSTSVAAPGIGATVAFNTSMESSLGITTTAAVNITINRVLDPSPVVTRALPPGERDVAFNVTIANVGNTTLFPNDQGDIGYLSIEWALDPEDAGPYNAPNPYNVPKYQTEDFPSATCQGSVQDFTSVVAPGQSVTGCLVFGDIPDDVKVSTVSARLLFAGTPNEPIWQQEWHLN